MADSRNPVIRPCRSHREEVLFFPAGLNVASLSGVGKEILCREDIPPVDCVSVHRQQELSMDSVGTDKDLDALDGFFEVFIARRKLCQHDCRIRKSEEPGKARAESGKGFHDSLCPLI